MFQLIKKISISVFVFLAFILSSQVLAATKPSKMEISKSGITLTVGQQISIRTKYKAAIRIKFKPEDAKADISVKSDNREVLELKKVDKYFFKLKAIKRGRAKVDIYSRINPKLKKTVTVVVVDKQEENQNLLSKENLNKEQNKNETKMFSLEDFSFTQGEPDWGIPNHPGIKVMGLNTKGMKLYLKLKDKKGKLIESRGNYDFYYKSSDETVFKMSGNKIIPVEKGKADIIAVYKYKGKEYEFIPAAISINDYAGPVSVVFNQDSTVVHSLGEDNSIRLKAVYDQYGNEMDLSDAEWSFSCFDYDVNPSAELSGSTLYVKGNYARQGIYNMNVELRVFGGSVTKVLEIIVRP